MPPPKLEEQIWYLNLPHESIVDLIWAVEASEGLAVVRVLDKARGLVELLIAPDLVRELERLIEDLNSLFPVRRVARPEGIESILEDEANGG